MPLALPAQLSARLPARLTLLTLARQCPWEPDFNIPHPCMRAARPILLQPRPRLAARRMAYAAGNGAARSWDAAVASHDPAALVRAYAPARELTAAELKTALRALVSVKGEPSQVAQRMFDDHAATHSSSDVVALGLRAYLRADSRAFEAFRSRFPHWQPDAADWSEALGALVERAPLAAVWSHWRAMLAAGAAPHTAALNALLARLFADEQAGGVQRVLTHTGLDALGVTGLEIVVRGCCVRTDSAFAEILPAAGRALRRALEAGARHAGAWHALLLHDARVFGWERMWATARSALELHAFTPSDQTVATLLRGYISHVAIATSDDALHAADCASSIAGVPPERASYSLLLRTVLGTQAELARTHEGVLLYQALRQRHVAPDAVLVQPLVDALCSAFVPALEPALALLDDVLPAKYGFFSRPPCARSPAHVSIFCALLGACAELGALDTAAVLFERMKVHGVPLDAGRALLHCRMLVRAAVSHEDAFRVYRAAAALRAFDRSGYERLLHFFCKHQLGAPCPPEHPLEILGDMRAAGYFPSAQTYTVLLDYYGKTPGSSPVSVRVVHELIKRDHAVKLDLILINTLMNAYNRTGAPAEAVAIWSSLVLLSRGTRRYMDDVSLAIVCDTCGRANMPGVARHAMQTAARLDAVPGARRLLTKAAYDAFVECLARCGAVIEATDVVATMKARPDTHPDAKTLDTLLKLARRAGHDAAVVSARLT